MHTEGWEIDPDSEEWIKNGPIVFASWTKKENKKYLLLFDLCSNILFVLIFVLLNSRSHIFLLSLKLAEPYSGSFIGLNILRF